MAGRVTRKAPELPLTVEERLALAEARDVISTLGEREPAPEALTELGYEQRMARMKAAELATQLKAATYGTDIRFQANVTELAGVIYRFIWDGETS